MISSLLNGSADDETASHPTHKLKLQKQLLESVKNCQTRFGGRSELATELDPCVSVLCQCLERVLCHGLKPFEKKPAFKQVTDLVMGNTGKYTPWDAIKEILSNHEKERYELLKQIWTDRGRMRAWLRSAVNERSIERYVSTLISSPNLKLYYEDWAFLRDPETNGVLPDVAAGLGSILFALSIDRPELNQSPIADGYQESAASTREEIIEDPSPIRKDELRKPKKSSKKVITFGDEDIVDVTYEETVADPVNCQSNMNEELGDVECGVEAAGALGDDLSISDTESKGDVEHQTSNSKSVLRTLTNSSIGELIPVQTQEGSHSSEDSLSVPSISEDAESTSLSNYNLDNNLEQIENDETRVSLKRDFKVITLKLESVTLTNTRLNSQLIQLAQQSQEKQSQLDRKILDLNRENELLKHQLRKYVSAVQMLKQEGTVFEGEELYQQKLVQVAEMHGELMELNDRLQRDIVAKEAVIRRLYLELEALRGPLGPTEIDVGTQIISLWIPSVFLTGSSQQHHVYQVHLRIGSEEWNIYRRYSQFYALHKNLIKQYPVISAFQFPPKKALRNKGSKFVEERRLKLQHYMRRLMNHLVANHAQLASCPSRDFLVTVIPFFGDADAESPERTRPSHLVNFPRSAGSPQYTGL